MHTRLLQHKKAVNAQWTLSLGANAVLGGLSLATRDETSGYSVQTADAATGVKGPTNHE